MKTFLLTLIALFLISAPTFSQDQVGPEKCLTCHNNVGLGDMTGWRSSMHANGYSVQLDDAFSMQDLYGMVNDYDENGIDDFKDGLNFNNIDSKFDPYKPNAPILSYSAEGGYKMQMGDVTHKVIMTYGGSGLYKQRYMLSVETSEGFSKGYYVSPVQYNEKTKEYVVYHGSDWYDASNLPIYTSTSTLMDIAGNSRNIAKNCSGCHSNGLEVWQDDNNEWLMKGAPVDDEAAYDGLNNVFDIDGDGNLDQINTTCERCHGPGSDHAAAPTKENIINPLTDLTAEQNNNLCGMCHSRGKSKPNNTFGFPFQDDASTLVTWAVGDLVEPIYTNGGKNFGDGVTSSSHHQQFWDLYQSDKPTFQYHPVSCNECHDVHNEVLHHVRSEIVEKDTSGADVPIATASGNNTLCLACHATHGAFADISVEMVADYDNNVTAIGEIVSAHTKHSYDPEGIGTSNCVSCHMAVTSKSAVAYDVHGHTFEAIPPEKTKMYTMPNSCAVSCHGNVDAAGGDFGTNITVDDRTFWGGIAQQDLADSLMYYYGPDGKWWTHSVTTIDITENEMPTKFSLSQNYPNPFNPTTNIVFELPKSTTVSLKVYNVVGQLITTLIDNEDMTSGKKLLQFDASNLSAGLYFYTLKTATFTESKKMVLIK
ncbi:MAG: T9SS C-terminal target domain-containing protein [Calditrichaeota bacterium]|nr:MAG: T9SS C-terminal target domain-containing protein [Calditrichota bacterium]MBL1206246.1 T9SS C-terminal target domain-containing protein [Calditrichota bacterium]NOG46072.1 T9SS type A sorting domain-containing protein [Calditrichota bacterium]